MSKLSNAVSDVTRYVSKHASEDDLFESVVIVSCEVPVLESKLASHERAIEELRTLIEVAHKYPSGRSMRRPLQRILNIVAPPIKED